MTAPRHAAAADGLSGEQPARPPPIAVGAAAGQPRPLPRARDRPATGHLSLAHVIVTIVVVALRADGRLLALLPQRGGEPYGAVAPVASRAALLGRAATWAADALPLRTETHCLLAADVPADAAAPRTVVVVWPLLDVDPSSDTLSQLAAGNAGDWCTLDEATSPTARLHAALALCTINSFRATAEAAAPRHLRHRPPRGTVCCLRRGRLGGHRARGRPDQRRPGGGLRTTDD